MHFLTRSRYKKNIISSLLCCALTLSLTGVFAQESKTNTSSSQKKTSESKAKTSSQTKNSSKSKEQSKTKTSKATQKTTPSKPAPKSAKVAAAPTTPGRLQSQAIYVQDLNSDEVIYARNDDDLRPIASITKLMTAIVIVDARLPMNEVIEITEEDVDRVKFSTSRLSVGTRLTREDLLHLALMSSDNRAAHALGRTYPGGMDAMVQQMNQTALSLGMLNSRFVESTGLSSDNVSTPKELVKLLQASAKRPLIVEFTTSDEHEVRRAKGQATLFRNTNALIRKPEWDIKVSKTGFISEAGRCLVMVARINNRDTAIVLLDAGGKATRIGDATRIREMVQRGTDPFGDRTSSQHVAKL